MKKTFFFLFILFIFIAFQQTQTTWVAIGDSITYLNDHPNETGNRITKGYMTLIKEKYPQLNVINQGHNGWTSGGIADKIEQIQLVPADIYTIFLGTNDWWQGRPIGIIADYKENSGSKTIFGAFRIIIDKLKNLNPNAKIILISPMQRGDFVYITNFKNNAFGNYKEKKGQHLSQVVEAINQIATLEKIPFVDLYNKSGIHLKNMVKYKRLKDPKSGLYKNYKYPSYLDVPFNPETDEYPYPIESINMTYDGLHPSDKGYKAISKLILKEFKKIEVLK